MENKESQFWKINGMKIDICVPLFEFLPVEMLNIRTMKKEFRLIWGLDSTKVVSLYGSSRGGSVLVEPPTYELLSCTKSSENPSGFKKVRKRIQVSGQVMLAMKLSTGLQYDKNSMNLAISPHQLEELITKASSEGNYYNEGDTARFTLIRSNDLRREMNPSESDHWLVLKTLDPQALQALIIPINEAEKKIGSLWREISENEDPRFMQLLEEIKG